MMKFTFCAFIAALILAGCASKPPPDVTTFVSNANGLRTDLLSENMLETEDKTPEVLWLNAARAFLYNSTVKSYLELDYLSSQEHGFLEIPPGETLSLTIDGNLVKFTGPGSGKLRRKTKNETVTERAVYEVDPAIFTQLATAQKVHVQITGDRGTVDRFFGAENFRRFADFAKKIAP
jgi:hypothetical protein